MFVENRRFRAGEPGSRHACFDTLGRMLAHLGRSGWRAVCRKMVAAPCAVEKRHLLRKRSHQGKGGRNDEWGAYARRLSEFVMQISIFRA